MPVAFLFEADGIGQEEYDGLMERLGRGEGDAPAPHGFIAHLAGATDAGWRAGDVWGSEAAAVATASRGDRPDDARPRGDVAARAAQRRRPENVSGCVAAPIGQRPATPTRNDPDARDGDVNRPLRRSWTVFAAVERPTVR